MNNVSLIGRWVRDHDVSTVGQQGTTLVKNTIAVDHPFKKDATNFLRVVMWGKTGELANQYTSKGSQVGIEGHLETGSYDDKDGKKIFTVDVVVNRIKFLEPKSSNPQNTQNNAGTGYQGQANTNTSNYNSNSGNQQNLSNGNPFGGQGGPIELNNDDLPF